MTTPGGEYRNPAHSFARRARRDLLAVVLIVVGVVGCGVCTAMVSLWAAGAVLSLIIAGVGVAIGLDREGARR